MGDIGYLVEREVTDAKGETKSKYGWSDTDKKAEIRHIFGESETIYLTIGWKDKILSYGKKIRLIEKAKARISSEAKKKSQSAFYINPKYRFEGARNTFYILEENLSEYKPNIKVQYVNAQRI